MLTVDDAPSVVADQPELRVHRDNLSMDGILVASQTSVIPTNERARIGSLLLAKDRKWDSWHECAVIGVDGDLLTLVWSELPESEMFTRRMWQLGTLHLRETGQC